MIVPAVGFIESAAEAIGTVPDRVTVDELREFRAFGQGRIMELRKKHPRWSDVELGYLLGLETARACLAGMPAAHAADVSL